MIYKLYEHQYGCEPQDSPRQLDSKAPEAANKDKDNKLKESKDDELSDYYDDDFDVEDDKEKLNEKSKDKDKEDAKK